MTATMDFDLAAIPREYPQFGKSVWNVGRRREEVFGGQGSCQCGGSKGSCKCSDGNWTHSLGGGCASVNTAGAEPRVPKPRPIPPVEVPCEHCTGLPGTGQAPDPCGGSPQDPETSPRMAQGVCGKIIDDWILDEMLANQLGWGRWVHQFPTHSSMQKYLPWANGNQIYKDDRFFKFNGDGKDCGTREGEVGCGRTVTLCGKCLRSSTLGNIMFGIVGATAVVTGPHGPVDNPKPKRRVVRFNHNDMKKASAWKASISSTVDKHDELAYGVGEHIGRIGFEGELSISAFCALFQEGLGMFPGALCEGNSGTSQPNSFVDCKPCTLKTTENRHGGGETPSYLP